MSGIAGSSGLGHAGPCPTADLGSGPEAVSVGCSTMTGEKNLKKYISLADQRMYDDKEGKKRQ